MCEETNETILTHHLSVFFVVLAHVLILAATSRNEVLVYKANDENKTKQKDQKNEQTGVYGKQTFKKDLIIIFLYNFRI